MNQRKQVRRQRAFERLERQLESGVKKRDGHNLLGEGDKDRIICEREVLRRRLGGGS